MASVQLSLLLSFVGANLNPQQFFHTTHADLDEGATLLPHSETGASPWASIYERDPDQRWRAEKVWMFGKAGEAQSWGGSHHVYEVEPVGEVGSIAAGDKDEESLDYDMPRQFHAPRAIVKRRLS